MKRFISTAVVMFVLALASPVVAADTSEVSALKKQIADDKIAAEKAKAVCVAAIDAETVRAAEYYKRDNADMARNMAATQYKYSMESDAQKMERIFQQGIMAGVVSAQNHTAPPKNYSELYAKVIQPLQASGPASSADSK